MTELRHDGYTDIMREEISIGRRGTITLPAKMRHKFGLEQNDKLIIEETKQGLLLLPAVSMPIEIYTEERIKEFAGEEEALGKKLDQMNIE